MRDYSSGCVTRARVLFPRIAKRNTEAAPGILRRPLPAATVLRLASVAQLRLAASFQIALSGVFTARGGISGAAGQLRGGKLRQLDRERIHRSSSTNSALMLNCRSIVLGIETAT
jgi:hypothetical protein